MTIKDLARESGYSVGTVSRVLNDHTNVSDRARAAVMDVVRRRGFELNTNAKNLKQSRSNSILLIAIGCFVFTFLRSITRFLIHTIDLTTGLVEGDNLLVFYVFNELIPALSVLLLVVLPILLLVRNLMNKSGKILPIIAMAVNAVFMIMSIVNLPLPAIYRYILWSTLGVVDTTVGVVMMNWCGSVILLAGYVLTVSGSILSLLDRSKKVEEAV